VRDIKKKMGEFLWLIRGLPDYTADIFKFFIGFKREDPTSDRYHRVSVRDAGATG